MDVVETNLENGIYSIILSRPKQFNALNWDMLLQFTEAVNSIENDHRVRCVVIEGKGANFMAGGDIVFFHGLLDSDTDEMKRQFSKLISQVHVLVEQMAELPVPVIAKVRGAAAGFGISLVAGCDLAIGADDSFYTSAYNLLGTSPDGGSTFYLPRSVGMKKAIEIVLTSKRYSAEEALKMGLISDIATDAELDAKVDKTARFIAKSARAAVRNAKRLVQQSFQQDLSAQLKLEQELFLDCAVSDDFKEGVRAFVEKRNAKFKS